MENSSSAAASHYLVLQEACGINLFLGFLTWSVSMFQILHQACSCKSCSCNCNCKNHSSADKVIQTPIVTTDKEVEETKNKDRDDETALTQEDIKMVMRNIGINHLDQEMNSLVVGSDSITRIFDDDEPSLQEVWQAFLVFDHNNDGYFDASDLQRVLKSLGLGDSVGVDECEQMIAKYDTNKDGRIDVAEFTKVLEFGIC